MQDGGDIPKNGLEEFRDNFLSDIQSLWKWTLIAAALPLLAHLMALSPPWPPSLAYLTALIELLSLMCVFQILRHAGRRTINRVLIGSVLLLMIISTLYLIALSLFTYSVPNSSPQVKGYRCTIEAQAVFAEKCPTLGRNEIKLAEWDAERLWTAESIAPVRVSLVVLWLSSFMALSIAVGSFVGYQRNRSARESLRRRPDRQSIHVE